ncbi:MAG: hypothetical protein KKE57_07660, partial [Proteobacteria bacterium]|nr:hypothetical protein [Pseudomonadota bacterium]
AKNRESIVACCQSLGQIGDPASIEPLAKILMPGMPEKLFFWRKRYGVDVRASAALAVAQIDHPRVSEILAGCAEDKDPRIREIARSKMPSGDRHVERETTKG